MTKIVGQGQSFTDFDSMLLDLDLVTHPKNGLEVATLATNQRGDDLINVKFKKKNHNKKNLNVHNQLTLEDALTQ